MPNKDKKTNYNPISLNNLVHGFKKGMTAWNKGMKGLKLSDGLKKWWENGGIPWNKGMKGFMKGEKNGRWIKDRTLLKKRDKRNDSAYQYWRKEVLKKCPKCFFYGDDCQGDREAHHIMSWKDYPKLRYDVNNGITFCHKHHPRTRKQVEKFLAFYLSEKGTAYKQ